MNRSFGCTGILFAGLSSLLYGQCEAPAPVRQVLDEASRLWESDLTSAEREAKQRALYTKALEDRPYDYFLLRALMQVEDKQDARIRWAEGLRARHPDQPVFGLLHAEALAGKDTPAAIKMMEGLAAAHPEMSRSHLALVGAMDFGKFKDAGRLKRETEAFLKQCPAPLNGAALARLTSFASTAQLREVSAAVRRRLAQESGPTVSGLWERLWRLEFKARAPGEHDALRKEIAQDLSRLEKAPERRDLFWMKFLAAGYESAGNAEGKRKIQDEILEEYPVSKAAQEILRDRWDKQHPYPRGSDKAQLEVWSRASVERYREWQRRWPKDSLLAFSLFTSLANLPEATAEEIGREGEAMLALYRRNPDWSSMPSMEHRVADAYLKYKASIDKVPALAEEGCRRTIERQEEQLQDDRLPDELRTAMQDSMVSAKLERARLLLDYYAAVKQPDKGREIELELAALSPAKAHGKASLLERRAQAAELLGHRLDALLLYREALRTRPPGRVFAAGEDKLAVNVERLWKELGGTAAAWPLLTEKAKATEATDSRWERPKNPLPSFSLTDLEGKTWKLAALEGKPVLINVWATWCGPCRSEHPAFQKLYDKLKDSGVAVLTFNVDDDLGKVAPYLKENRYTFPVLLARDVVDAVVPVVAIPQNWFVSAKGKLEWMQVGFGNEPNWEETMLAKLDEVRKQQ